MIDLARLSINPIQIHVTLRGQEVTLRPLSATDEKLLREAFPMTARVQVPDGRGGHRIDASDPRQQEADRWRNLQLMAATVAVASGTAAAGDKPGLEQAVATMLERLTSSEIAAAWDMLVAAVTVDRSKAEGN